MRPSALIERYRFALEVIAQGPEWEPATKTARMALLPPEVWSEVRVVAEDLERREVEPVAVMTVSEICADGLHTLCRWPACECECHREAVEPTNPEAGPLWRVTQTITPVEPDAPSEPAPDLEREPTSQPELDDDEPVGEPDPDPDLPSTDGLSPLAMKVLRFVRTNGQVSSAAIRAFLGGEVSDPRRKKACAELVERGLIVAEGASINRRYLPVTSEEQVPQEAPEPVALKVGTPEAPKPKKAEPTDEGRLLEAVKFRPKWTIEQHAARLDMPQDRVAMALRKLEEEGEVQTFARGGRVAWVLR